jgi:spermidine synthase
MQLLKTRRGARLLHDGHVVSEVLARPGPTHSIFDVLAAGMCLHPSPFARIGLLGFAGGGVLAPLRAMGSDAPVHAVDLSLKAAPLFRKLCGSWAKPFQLTEKDALLWLEQGRQHFDVLVEDLSIQVPNDVTKPDVSLQGLPGAMARRLAPCGVVVVNALPVPGLSWAALTHALTHPFQRVQAVEVRGFSNRVLLAGSHLPKARAVGETLRFFLGGIGSKLANGVAVRQVRT